MHLITYRKFDAVPMRQQPYGGGGARTFNYLSYLFRGILGAYTTRKCEAETAVARLVVRACEDEVAQSGKPHEGFTARAELPAQSHHLRQTTSDQRGTAVGPEPQPIGHSRGNGNDILDRSAKPDAAKVGGGVDAKCIAMEHSGYPLRIS